MWRAVPWQTCSRRPKDGEYLHRAVVAAASAWRVLLADTGPQRCAGDWWRARTTDDPRLVECAAKRALEVLRAAKKDGTELVVVDTRPSVEADTAEIARLQQDSI
jgi:chromosome partitioning protein